jgi:hypothetical protein
MMGIGQLDTGCATAFAVGLFCIAWNDALLRRRKIPDCVLPTLTTAVHKHAKLAEAWAMLVLMFSLAFLAYENMAVTDLYYTTTTYTNTNNTNNTHLFIDSLDADAMPAKAHASVALRVVTLCACTAAPMLISMAPRHQHHMVTYEAAVPVAGFLALATVYTFSATVTAQGEAVLPPVIDGFQSYMIAVSLLFPVTIFALLHALHTGFAIALCTTCACWLLLHTTALHAKQQPWVVLTLGGMLLALLLVSFAYMVYYRHRHIISQVSIALQFFAVCLLVTSVACR